MSSSKTPLKTFRRESAAASFLPTIDTSLQMSVGRQLYLQLRDSIVYGRLRGGSRLPSTRTASAEWKLSRGVIAGAYELLIAEGYVIGKHGSGTYVADNVEGPTSRERTVPLQQLKPGPRNISLAARSAVSSNIGFPAQIAFATGRVMHDERTAMLLKRLAHRHIDYARDGYRDSQGEPALREGIASFLIASRGVRCTAQQIFITSGTQQALDLAVRTLLSPGEEAIVEDPCYPPAKQVLAINSAKIIGVPVDSEGIVVEAIARVKVKPKVIFVTPSHQYPQGAILSLTRRLALLALANQHGSWIIENDYDSEFRYEGHAIASIQGLDANDRVIYVGSFSKALLPGLRVGYLVVPQDLVDTFRAVRPILDRFPPPFNQLVIADFLNEGYFPAHLRRLRDRHQGARDLLVEMLNDRLSAHLVAAPAQQGVHLTVSSTGSWADDCAVTRAALEVGVVVTPVSPMYISAPSRPGLLLGFSGLSNQETYLATERLTRIFNA